MKRMYVLLLLNAQRPQQTNLELGERDEIPVLFVLWAQKAQVAGKMASTVREKETLESVMD